MTADRSPFGNRFFFYWYQILLYQFFFSFRFEIGTDKAIT